MKTLEQIMELVGLNHYGMHPDNWRQDLEDALKELYAEIDSEVKFAMDLSRQNRELRAEIERLRHENQL